MKILTLFLYLVLMANQSFTQNIEPWKPPVNFLIPDAYNFMKYGEIPVSEYTGIPEISIPVYTIELEGCNLPIKLNYHSGGIKVSEEASWIGLGWDLQTGNIVQVVNGTDDFSPPYNQMVLPDYIYSPMEYPFQNKIYDQINHDDHEIKPPYYSFVIFRDNIMLKDGFLTTPIDDYFYKSQKDCAPDILKASFNGHTVQIIKDPKTGFFQIIDKKGYRISTIELPNSQFGFKITTPDGTEYYFEKLTTTTYGTTSNGHILNSYQSTFPEGYDWDVNWSNCTWTDKKSRIWYLTKIKSIKNELVTFDYTESGLKRDYSIDSRWTVYTGYGQDRSMTYSDYDGPFYFGYSARRMLLGEFYDNDINISLTMTSTTSTYLQKITFPKGYILFSTASRSDYTNAKKLNQIAIYTPNKTVKSLMFHHSYFQSYPEGWRFGCPKTNEELNTRLKLDSIKFSGEPPYVFAYNSDQLPPKNSFATDYWGYYNGSFQNTSFLPNVFRIEHITPNNGIKNLLLPNTNNNGSNLYSKACLLERIQYPTGGATSFEFDMNTFNNYIVADYDFVPITNNQINRFNNTVTTGQGLRISTITNWQGAELLSKTKYFYEGGKSIVKLGKYNSYSDAVFDRYDGTYFRRVGYDNIVLYSGNFYASSTFGSGSYVGYDKVTSIKYDNDIQNGKTVKYFTNTPDSYPQYVNQYEFTKYSQKPDIDNGLIHTEEVFSNYNLIQKTYNFYRSIQNATPYYGAEFKQLGVYGFWRVFGLNGVLTNSHRHDLVFYFPIIQKETLLDSTLTENYYDHFLKSSKSFEYNTLNLISAIKSSTSNKVKKITKYTYPSEAQSSSKFNSSQQYIFNQLASSNRINTICCTENWTGSQWNDEYRNFFKEENGLLLLESVKKYP